MKMIWLTVMLLLSIAFGGELTLERVIGDTLKNNLELKALKHELKSYELEYKSARAQLFPNLKIEESFTRTDIPAYVLFTKLNQERITPVDFTPANLNNPSAVNNFETKLSLELPLWLGGKLRAFKNMALYKKQAQEKTFLRKQEEVLFKAYEAFLGVSLANSAVEVARKNVHDAQEHLRIAKKLHKVGMALLSDILRAEVFLKKAQEKLTEAENKRKVALKALSLVTNTSYEGYTYPRLPECRSLNLSELKEKALKNRQDLIALEDSLRILKEGYRASVGDTLPQVFAFASYNLYDKDTPFGSQGSGYMFGVKVSLSFNTGLSPIYKARSFREKERMLLARRELLRKAILFEVDKAYSEYETSLTALESAKARLKSAQEAVRIIRTRYENGLARMVDLLDAQTQLENARFDYLQALYRCNLSYGKALLGAGIFKEVIR